MTRVPSQSVKCPFSLCTISSSCRPFILRVQRIINPNKPTFVKNILKTSAQKSIFWVQILYYSEFFKRPHRSLINSTLIKLISSQMFTGKCSAKIFTKNSCFLRRETDDDNVQELTIMSTLMSLPLYMGQYI